MVRKFYLLSRCRLSSASLGFVAPVARATDENNLGASAWTFKLPRIVIGMTSTSARFLTIAVQTASATCAGVTSPARRSGLRPVTGHIPAWLTNVGQTEDTPA